MTNILLSEIKQITLLYLSVLDDILQHRRSSIMTGFPGQFIVVGFSCAWLTQDDWSFGGGDSDLRAVERQNGTGGHGLQGWLFPQHLIWAHWSNQGKLT